MFHCRGEKMWVITCFALLSHHVCVCVCVCVCAHPLSLSSLALQAVVEDNMRVVSEKVEQLEASLSKLQGNNGDKFDIDAAVDATRPLYKQYVQEEEMEKEEEKFKINLFLSSFQFSFLCHRLLQLAAKDNVLDDAIYQLDKALERGLDLNHYLRVRNGKIQRVKMRENPLPPRVCLRVNIFVVHSCIYVCVCAQHAGVEEVVGTAVQGADAYKNCAARGWVGRTNITTSLPSLCVYVCVSLYSSSSSSSPLSPTLSLSPLSLCRLLLKTTCGS